MSQAVVPFDQEWSDREKARLVHKWKMMRRQQRNIRSALSSGKVVSLRTWNAYTKNIQDLDARLKDAKVV